MACQVTAEPASHPSYNNMQIMTGIGVNSEADFPKLREYCPSAIFPQLKEISLTIDR